MTGPNSPSQDGLSSTCPVVQYNGVSFWPFSYIDNRMAINVVGYDSSNNVVSQLALSGPRYIWKVTVDDAAQTVTFWGQSNQTATIPWSKLSMPVVSPVSTGNAPTPPSGNKVSCMTGPNSPSPDGLSSTCPVVLYNGVSFWPLSYIDNRMAINVVGYDSSNNVVSQLALSGPRYIWKVTVDDAAQTVTFWGQSNQTATIPWSKLE